MRIETIEDGNTRFDLVELRDDGGIGRKTPHCKIHGAMVKVSKVFWRCPQAINLLTGKSEPDCRAGCKEVEE